MERAGRLIAKLNRQNRVMTNEDLVRAAWPLAVGKKIASQTVFAALVRETAVIEVRDIVWQRQLNTLSAQILKNLTDIVGPGIAAEMAFRPMTPKREPQRAAQARPQLVRRISRNKASA